MIADEAEASIIDSNTGKAIFQAVAMGNIWVELSASGSSAHGPALRIRNVSLTHPQVKAQLQAEAARGSRANAEAATVAGEAKRKLGGESRAKAGLHRSQHNTDGAADNASASSVQQSTDGDASTGTTRDEVVKHEADSRADAIRIQHKKAAVMHPSSIAAVLASTTFPDDGEGDPKLDAHVASTGTQHELTCIQTQSCIQLINHSILPGVSAMQAVNGKRACTLWEAQLRLGKLAAKLNASFTTSERMHRLQEKLHTASLQVAELQRGLVC